VPGGFKYPDATLRLVANPSLDDLIEQQPMSIGSIQINDQKFTGYVSIPSDQMSMLVSSASRLQFIELNGTPLRYRKALIDSVHLGTAPD